jgi:hypothetical protein
MGFRVVPAVAPDPTTPPAFLVLPSITRLTGGTRRPLALIEKAAVGFDEAGEAVEGRVEALLGEVDAAGMLLERKWMDRCPRTRQSAPPRFGSSTTRRPTPTRYTSTRSPSRS